jgi:hypothetical protein
VTANGLANQDIKIGQTLSINSTARLSTQTVAANLETSANVKKWPETNKVKVKKSNANKSKIKKTKSTRAKHKKLKKKRSPNSKK